MDFSFIPDIYAAWAVLDTSASYGASDILRVGISLIVLVGGICSIFFIIWGGLMLILSGGKEEKVKPAINSIRYAVIGIIVIVIAIFVAPKASEMLGFGSYDYLSPQSIFDTISTLMARIFWESGGGAVYNPNGWSQVDFTDL